MKHAGRHAVFRCDVGAQLACARTNPGYGGGAFFVIDVEQRDLGAVRDEVFGYGEAEPGYAAGDDGPCLIELQRGLPCDRPDRGCETGILTRDKLYALEPRY